MFNSGQFAVLANVGTLAYPMTKGAVTANSVRGLAAFLRTTTSIRVAEQYPDKPFVTGWGGRSRPDERFNSNNKVSMSITLTGRTRSKWEDIDQYAVSTAGAIALIGSGTTGTNGIRTTAMNDALCDAERNLFDDGIRG